MNTTLFCLWLLIMPLCLIHAGMRVHAIHVGYGDCIAVEHTGNENPSTILVDTGGKKYGKQLYRYLSRRSLLPVNRVIITHQHPNHYGGLAYLIAQQHTVQIKEIYWNGSEQQEKEFQDILISTKRLGIPVTVMHAGFMLPIASSFTITCLHPETRTDIEHDNALVLQMVYFDTSVFLTGDIGHASQNQLAHAYPGIISSADIIKLPHHGDKLDASFSELISHAPFPILTTGKNKYQLPAVETLNLFGKNLLRTDCCLDIVLESDGTAFHRLPPRKK